MFEQLFGQLLGPITQIIKQVVPDPNQQAQLSAQLATLRESDTAKQIDEQLSAQLAALANVKAEAQGASWLQRNWRPIVALWFAGLVGAYWFGWTPPNLAASAIDGLFTLVKICLGGYYVGRSAEKIAQTVTPAITAGLSK